MKDLSYILYANWLKVPDILYFVLLVGGWMFFAVSISFLVFSIIRKCDMTQLKKWLVIFFLSMLLILFTMTGKIAPNMAFGG